MIDTDKYEGHTEGPWKHFYAKGRSTSDWEIISEKNGVVGRWENRADARLMADAPLLLAEVKRLREQNKLMVDYFRFMRDGGFTDADWRTVNEWIGDEEE